jgi:hypothetical protein
MNTHTRITLLFLASFALGRSEDSRAPQPLEVEGAAAHLSAPSASAVAPGAVKTGTPGRADVIAPADVRRSDLRQASSGVVVYRTMMPDSGPSSFAVGLAPDLGLSYDPGRGGVNYIWRGPFADLGPTWKAKINEPAVIRGAMAYRESARYPLRLGSGAHEPGYAFKGYVLGPDSVEFHYMIDGILVREAIRGDGAGGIVRRFQADRPVEQWRYFIEPQSGVSVWSPQGRWDEQKKCVVGAGGVEFALHIQLVERAP